MFYYANIVRSVGVSAQAFSFKLPSQATIASILRNYLRVIIAEELRHISYKHTNVQRPPIWLPLISPPFPRSARYPRSLASRQEGIIYEHLDEIISLFNRPGWSTSYGGHAWAEICNLLKINNNTIFLNYVFHAAHCNGSIFNKIYEAEALQVEDEQKQAQRLTTFLTRVSNASTANQVLKVLKEYTIASSYLGSIIRSFRLPKKEKHAK